MIENELFINGKEIKLSDETRIGVTFQANNLGELQNRQGSFTNTFKIRNAINAETLELLNLMSSASIIPYRRNTATYLEGGIEIVSEGEAIITKSDIDFTYINVIGGNVDLSRAIGDVIVGELYFEDSPHTWNLSNAYNSRTGSEYYIYPLLDWRIDLDSFFNAPSVNIQEMLPCCVVSGLFERLEKYTGYSFIGSYIESEEHKNMILTPDYFSKNPEYLEDEQTNASFITAEYRDAAFLSALEGSGIVTSSFPVELASNGVGFFEGSYFAPLNNVGKLRFTGTIAARQVYINGGLGFLEFPKQGEYWFTVQIKKGGLVIAENTFEHQVGDIYELDGFRDFVVDISTPEILLTTGDQYFCNVIANTARHSNADVQTQFGFIDNRAVFSHIPSESLVFGNDIRFRDLFRMKAKDVLKDILNLRGLIIQTNSYTKEVQFNFFQDLLDNKIRAIDWSDKVDIRSSELTFKFGRYAQRNWGKFKENDSVEKGYGDYYFDIDDTTLDDEATAIKIGHPATHQNNKYLGYNIPKIEAVDSLNKWQKPEYRILQIDRKETSFNVTFTDGTGSEVTTTSIPFARFHGFEELIPQYYEVLIDILDRTKGIVLVLKLTPVDIQELDFSIPIKLFIPEIEVSGDFYINKINNYKQGFTAVEFVRL